MHKEPQSKLQSLIYLHWFPRYVELFRRIITIHSGSGRLGDSPSQRWSRKWKQGTQSPNSLTGKYNCLRTGPFVNMDAKEITVLQNYILMVILISKGCFMLGLTHSIRSLLYVDPNSTKTEPKLTRSDQRVRIIHYSFRLNQYKSLSNWLSRCLIWSSYWEKKNQVHEGCKWRKEHENLKFIPCSLFDVTLSLLHPVVHAVRFEGAKMSPLMRCIIHAAVTRGNQGNWGNINHLLRQLVINPKKAT